MSVQQARVQAPEPAVEEARLLERCERAVDEARRAGADEAEACAGWVRTASVAFEQGDLKLAQVDEGATLGLRVFRGERLGFASTNQGDEGAVAEIARDACGLAAYSVPDPANRLPEQPAPAARASLLSPEVAALGIDDVVERGLELASRISARDARIAIDKASFSVTVSSAAIASSAGVRAAESDSAVSLSAFGMAVDGEDVGGFDYWGDTVRELALVDGALEETVERFCDAVLANLGAGTAKSYRGPVLFAPAAFLSVFVSPVLSAASAIAVQRGRSVLAGKLSEQIAVPALSIVDDPTDASLAGAGALDREGRPTGRFAVVERGALRSYLYNAYAARVEGRESTGHATGGPRSLPGLGPHAVTVASGDGGSRADLLRALGSGLYVQRFSGTVDPASGDFSGVAKSARWVEGGEVVRSVKETLVSGNAFELLHRIVALSDAERVFGSSRAPAAIVDGVSVTAG